MPEDSRHGCHGKQASSLLAMLSQASAGQYQLTRQERHHGEMTNAE
jgi:hypothetical protein